MDNATVVVKFKGDTSDVKKSTESVKSDISSKIGGVAKGIGTAFLKGTAVAGAALAGMVAKGVGEYAKLEQSIGGVETLFKDSANTVIANAKKAYETAGVDANKYMEQVTSFSASLLQATGGDTAKAAQTADMAIIDMADNANKMGTSVELIQNAYQGFAKQNYMMLDNLKLGYGGTKTEMERLLADAQKISGIKYDINNLNDVYSAIHVIQGELGITGTTAKEASSTIQGSAASMKSAFTNFLSGAGGIEEVISTVQTFGTNVMNAVIELAPKIINGLVQLVNALIPKIPPLIAKVLPVLLKGVVSLVQGIAKALPKLIQVLAQMLPSLISTLIKGATTVTTALAQMLPTLLPMVVNALLDGILAILDNINLIINAGIEMMMGLIKGIITAIPILIAKLPLIIQGIINGLMGALPQLITMAPQIIITLITGIVEAIPMLIKMAPEIITGLITGMIKGFKNMYDTGKQILDRLWKGISSAIPKLVSEVPKIPSKIKEGIKKGLTNVGNIGQQMMKGLWNGISGLKNWVVDKVKGMGKSILKSLKNVLGIHSPSTEFAILGKFSVLGYTEALDKMSKDVDKQVADTFGLNPQLTGSMQNTFSPNVNVYNNVNVEQDPLGQVVSSIKTFSGGAKNDYNYGSGI